MITPSFGLTATERVLPKLALDFTTASLDSRITFTRALNTATRVNSSGYIESVNADVARFDYDPITKVCKGLLVEESRANLIFPSSDFSAWTKSANVSVATDDIASPSNAVDADKVTWASSGPYSSIQKTATVANDSNPNTISVFVKAGTIAAIFIKADYSGGTAKSAEIVLRLSDMVVLNTPGFSSYAVTNFGNGWYRVTGTLANNGTGNTSLALQILQGSGFGVETGYAYFWGAQVEAGAFPTSYIPTTTTALTRNADVATMTGTNFSSWFNASEGAIYAETSVIAFVDTQALFGIGDLTQGFGTGEMMYSAYTSSSAGRIISNVFDGGVQQVNLDPQKAQVINTVTNSVFAYKLNSFAASVSAVMPVLDASGTLPTVTGMSIGSLVSAWAGATQYMNGHIRKLFYYRQRLTDNEVQAFSK